MNLLLNIQLRHTFFQDGYLQEVTLEPSQQTRELLTRFGLNTRLVPGGLQVFCAREPKQFLAYLQQVCFVDSFRFYFKGDKSAFFFITELPEKWKGEVLLDSGMTEDDSTESVDLQLRLSAEIDSPLIGTIDIRFNDLLARFNRQFAPNYHAQFSARNTYWYYYLINQTGVRLSDPGISNQTGIAFNSPESVEHIEGGVLGFDSGDYRFPMAQIPKHIFSLTDKVQASFQGASQKPKVLIHGLPTPDKENIHFRIKDGEERVYSEMYVYL